MRVKSIVLSLFSAVLAAGAGFVGFSTLSSPAIAQASNAKLVVDQAKKSGVIGETPAGYLAVVDSRAGAEIVNAMNEINIGRKSVYTRLARQQNVQVEVVAALTGEKQIAKARPGEKVMMASGAWTTVK